MKSRLLAALGLAGLAILTFLVLRPSPTGSDRPQAPPSEAPATAPPALPPVGTGRPGPEVLPEEPNPAPAVVEAVGPLGRDPAVLAERMKAEDGWVAEPQPPYTWRGPNGTRLTYVVRGDRITGALATFAPRAMSADLKAVSPWLVGNQDALPLHWEAYRPEDAEGAREGSFETARGVKVYYRGTLRTEGEPPYGPEIMEISLTPFPSAP